ncbi:uncharacterized protein LOC115678763 [Syzygium oleosum]|uniref:uncharacterized protein LOC115678763 n=1 Tax=Syzygium oleosum TaxID=219896 RepID=UPI0011D23C76|nr:uncharacterized protein LOC115678763 [Syzygium oleosum]
MLASRCKFPGISTPLSVGTFVKHLAVPISTRLHCALVDAEGGAKGRAVRCPKFRALTNDQKEQIRLYVDALLEWNQRMNLTAVREADEVMERHVEDSLSIIPPIRDSYLSHCDASCGKISVVDVGSGAGLPGLVLAIAQPDWQVTLVESMRKRCVFLEHAVNLAGVSNAEVVNGRAEDIGNDLHFREHFDVAVARAVAEMRVLAEYCLPLVRVGGLFVAAKGHNPEDEVKNAETAIRSMGASLLQVCPVESHGPYGQRTAIICLKGHPTPRKYPRHAGTPAKDPL